MEEKNRLNYQPKLLFSKEEVKLLKQTFGGTDNQLMTLLRKIFLPSLLDPEVPDEYMSNDLLIDIDFKPIPNEEVKSIVLARQEMIKWVRGSLVRLRQLANQPDEESPQDKEKRLSKDRVR